MILWGTLVSTWPIVESNSSQWKPWCLNFIGVVLALYVFMADSIRVAGDGVTALRNVLPGSFNWLLFCTALVLMATPIIQVFIQLRNRECRPFYYQGWMHPFQRNKENREKSDWSEPPSFQPKDSHKKEHWIAARDSREQEP